MKELFDEYLYYDESSPSGLRWKERIRYDFITMRAYLSFQSQYVNKVAGTICHPKDKTNPWWQLNLMGKTYVCSRVIYTLLRKDPGVFQIDHIDRDPLNNIILNLRLATSAENNCNRSFSKLPESGYRGVRKNGSGWQASIKKNGKTFHLGTYNSPEEADLIYRKSSTEIHKEFSHLS